MAKTKPPAKGAIRSPRSKPASRKPEPSAPAREVDPCTQYALDVVAGRIVAGKLVRLACQRHLDDLKTGHERGLWFSAEEAAAAYEFFALCPQTKGKKWAGRGFDLQPWQMFIIGCIVGWKRADGTRRFRYAWIEVARKNGKTTLLAPLALYLLVIDGEPGAEIYSVATKKDQARLVWQAARRMVVRSPELSQVIVPYRESLQVPATFGKFEPLGADADTLDGLDPSGILADEVHKWKNRDLYDVMDTATGARDQPLLACITTAGKTGSETVYGQEHERARQVLEGTLPNDDSLFAYIATIDEDDDWSDPKVFIKANPNLGISVQSAEIEAAIRKAKEQPSAAAAIKRLRLNMRTGSLESWITGEAWAACKSDIDWSTLLEAPCYGGLDLASTTDLASLSLCWPLNDRGQPCEPDEVACRFAFRWWFWMPADGTTYLQVRLRQIVAPWVTMGLIESTEGDCIDDDVIEIRVKEIIGQHPKFVKLAFDPFNAGMLAKHLAKEGIAIEQFLQRMRFFAEPSAKFEKNVINRAILHDGNPVMNWMFDNAIVVSDGAGNKMPSRKRSMNKIDGVMAGLMAYANAMSHEGTSGSYYDRHDAEFL